MTVEGMEFYKKTSVLEDEQFDKLSKQEKELYIALKNSKGIHSILWRYCEQNSIINFKTKEESGVVYFAFEIVEAVGLKYQPTVLFKVSGSVMETSTGKNIVYIIQDIKIKNSYSVYLDNTINVNDNMTLNEVLSIDPKLNNSRAEFISLTIKNVPSGKEKVITMHAECDIYKLYSNGKIDVKTLCNLALLQDSIGSSSLLPDKPSRLTKHLNTNIM